MLGENSANHDFVLATALSLGDPANGAPRILDFGCGTGTLVAKGRAQSVEIWGADAYPRHWTGPSDPTLMAFIQVITDARLPFPDGHFDVVVSNFVFEHMKFDDLDASLAEISRVLRPGGALLALFPSRDVWFEGHFGLYFPHRLRAFPRLCWRYLWLMHRLGLGYQRGNFTSAEWADRQLHILQTDVFHHNWSQVSRLFARHLGTKPTSLAPSFMRFRFSRLPSAFAAFAKIAARLPDPLLAFVCHKRAGRVACTRKA